MKHIRLFTVLIGILAAFVHVNPTFAQGSAPLALVMTINAPIMPSVQQYLERGIKTAEQGNAELLILELNTPGGSADTMFNMMEDIRNSTVPVVIYVAPREAHAFSAGAIITMSAHVAAMAPETAIGAASPVDINGADLDPTMKAKLSQAIKSKLAPLVEHRGPQAIQLANDMVDNAKAVQASDALSAHLVDFIATDVNDLLKQLDGFQVETISGAQTLHTLNITTQDLPPSLIEQLLNVLTDSNIVFILLNLGVIALVIELTHPGAWVPGFTGVVCLALAAYGLGILPVNWFGLIFIASAFVLFLLDLKAPTHGALTLAGVISLIVGALVLFNSPGTPQFQRVSVPLVVGVGVIIGAFFLGILAYALRSLHSPIQTGMETIVGKTGTVKSEMGLTGQVQVASELWTAEPAEGSDPIGKGDRVEVVGVNGLRLKVRKTK